MKKSISRILITSIFFASLYTSCGSTKNVPLEQDDYMSPSEETSIETEQKQKITTKNQTQKKEGLSSFISFGNADDFVIPDSCQIFTGTLTGTIKQKDASIYVNPKNETAGFGSTYLTAYYITQFDAEARNKLSKAVDQYLYDFENKKLDRKDKKSFKKYGTIDIHLDWGTIKTSTPNNGDGKAYIGYSFENKSPYFSIMVYPVHNNHWDLVSEAASEESINLKYCFTKAMAKELIEKLSEENIAGCFQEEVIKTISELDDYEE